MRFSPRSAASAFAGIVLLAGCSGLPQTQSALSNSPPASSARGLTPLKSIEYKIEGRIPSYLPRSELEREYRRLLSRPAQPRFHGAVSSGTIGMWAVNQYYGYLIGLTKRGADVTAVNVATNGCAPAETVKVDAAQHPWLACQLSGALGGAYQEYDGSGNFVNSYNWVPPACIPYTYCVDRWGYSLDGAANATDVFSAIETAVVDSCYTQFHCNVVSEEGFEWWPRGNPSATPTLINLDSYGLYDVGFMDLDASGNIWFDFRGCFGPSGCGNGIGEIQNPTSPSWKFVVVLGTSLVQALQCPQGIYVSHRGRTETLNINDPCVATIYRYKLPITASETYTTLGPTPTGILGQSYPLSGGFGKGDKYVVEGDTNGWLDLGKVSSNTWKQITSVDLFNSDSGAALTPSDK